MFFVIMVFEYSVGGICRRLKGTCEGSRTEEWLCLWASRDEQILSLFHLD